MKFWYQLQLRAFKKISIAIFAMRKQDYCRYYPHLQFCRCKPCLYDLHDCISRDFRHSTMDEDVVIFPASFRRMTMFGTVLKIFTNSCYSLKFWIECCIFVLGEQSIHLLLLDVKIFTHYFFDTRLWCWWIDTPWLVDRGTRKLMKFTKLKKVLNSKKGDNTILNGWCLSTIETKNHNEWREGVELHLQMRSNQIGLQVGVNRVHNLLKLSLGEMKTSWNRSPSLCEKMIEDWMSSKIVFDLAIYKMFIILRKIWFKLRIF